MSNKKQSSIDWLIDTLANQGLLITKDYTNLVAYRQAKETHKHEITEAFKQGIEYWNGDEWKLIDVEAYYNQTYEQ